jgi:hypothetical protein
MSRRVAHLAARAEAPAFAALRFVAGALLSFHGMQKLLGWPPGGHTAALTSQLGLGGVIELVCGVLVAVGLFTRPVAFLASGTMAVAAGRARVSVAGSGFGQRVHAPCARPARDAGGVPVPGLRVAVRPRLPLRALRRPRAGDVGLRPARRGRADRRARMSGPSARAELALHGPAGVQCQYGVNLSTTCECEPLAGPGAQRAWRCNTSPLPPLP